MQVQTLLKQRRGAGELRKSLTTAGGKAETETEKIHTLQRSIMYHSVLLCNVPFCPILGSFFDPHI